MAISALIERLLAGAEILALVLAEGNQRQVGAVFQPFPDLQTGRADFAVDEDFRGHVRLQELCAGF